MRNWGHASGKTTTETDGVVATDVVRPTFRNGVSLCSRDQHYF